jgi:Lrp/AsnC family transcriptional regulator
MGETVSLDDVDRRLLAALQRDAGLSMAALAEVAGASAASCWRRVKALEAAGVLKAAVRLVDPLLVGRGVNVICHLRLRNHEPPTVDAFQRLVADEPAILDCYRMSGEWDYLLRVAVADVADYDRFLMRGLLGHPAVLTVSSHFALAKVKQETALPV